MMIFGAIDSTIVDCSNRFNDFTNVAKPLILSFHKYYRLCTVFRYFLNASHVVHTNTNILDVISGSLIL